MVQGFDTFIQIALTWRQKYGACVSQERHLVNGNLKGEQGNRAGEERIRGQIETPKLCLPDPLKYTQNVFY